MNTSITSSDRSNTGTTESVDRTYAASSSSASTQGVDAFALINDLAIKMAALFRELRDTQRQYNENQQKNSYEIALTSYDTKMTGIEKDYEAGMKSANGELTAGLIGTFLSVFGLKTGNTLWGQLGNASGEAVKSGFDRDAKKLSREGQELSSLADFQRSLADGAEKRSDQTLEMARQASSDLKQMLEMVAQIHDKLTSALHR
ncbi:hypothetical protein EO087_10275 [Dyella sp. M7H15-1]|uniref:hypothetical protein n=1 Tax=Dyella sp. M7H15-1 TaxID=2501295 RepID=UPI0010051C1E|nr:hypothetical protein [Dyella sp. M7H15-1]QAU24328.1 hypothetical protein EO087_10275 [Dyella sp. M7H15-1]